MNATSYPDLTDYIFARPSSSNPKVIEHWKITGPAHVTFCPGRSYPVIKCTKTGKEFKSTNGFSSTYVLSLWNQGLLFKSENNEKASTDGIKSGIRKRRINHLVETMNKMVAELNELLEEEARTEVYELIVK